MKRVIVFILVFSLLLYSGCTEIAQRIEYPDEGFKAIDFGFSHIVALLNNGEVIAWGDNSHGQCDVPEQVENIVKVVSYSDHTLALSSEGKVFAWGDNAEGQCNVPEGLEDVVDIAVGLDFSIALKSDGTIERWGDTLGHSDLSSKEPRIIAITAAANHIFALTDKGELISTGWFQDDWEIPPQELKPLINIDTGYGYIIGLQNDNSVVAWGRAEYSENDVYDEKCDTVSISAGFGLSVALKRDGTVTVIGGGFYKLAEYAKVLKDINFACAGNFVGAAIRNDGKLIIWGYEANNYKNETLDNLIVFDTKY